MSTDVTWFSSSDPNAPQLDGTIGSLIAVLDACLLTGYGTVNVSALSVTDGLATATVDAGHGFGEACVVEIVGANGTAFNGRHKITIVSATQFAFPAGAASGTASGTITAKRAPVGGWSRPFSAADKAVYRADAGNRHFLRVGAQSSTVATWAAYQSMTDVDTGSGATSTYFAWISAGSAWRLFADQRAVLFVANLHTAFFGDLIAFDPSDEYATLIAGRKSTSTTASQPYSNWLAPFRPAGGRLLGDVDGISTNIPSCCLAAMGGDGNSGNFSIQLNGSPGANSFGSLFAPADWSGVWAMAGPVTICDQPGSGGRPRGSVPGVQCPAFALGLLSDGTIVRAPDGRAHQLVRLRQHDSANDMIGLIWIEHTGPWR